MELMLDTANLKTLEKGLSDYPIVGVTTNPSILKKEGNVPLWEHLRLIKELCGPKRSFHVQVVSNTDPGDPCRGRTHLAAVGQRDIYQDPGLPCRAARNQGTGGGRGKNYSHSSLYHCSGDARGIGGR